MAANTQLWTVNTLAEGLNIAHDMQASTILLDLEGVLIGHVGNQPTAEAVTSSLEVGYAALNVLSKDRGNHLGLHYGIITNNTNQPVANLPGSSFDIGVATYIGQRYSLPVVFKGMMYNRLVQRGKPSPDLVLTLCALLHINPAEAVLIDDQPMKNAGAAVSAGLKAIIAPIPIGNRGVFNRVREHRGVMASRFVERRVLRSYMRNGGVGKAVMRHFKTADLDIRTLRKPWMNEAAA